MYRIDLSYTYIIYLKALRGGSISVGSFNKSKNIYSIYVVKYIKYYPIKTVNQNYACQTHLSII